MIFSFHGGPLDGQITHLVGEWHRIGAVLLRRQGQILAGNYSVVCGIPCRVDLVFSFRPPPNHLRPDQIHFFDLAE